MKIQAKIFLGFLSAFIVILMISFSGIYYVKMLAGTTENFLEDNFYSVQLGKEMALALDQMKLGEGEYVKTSFRDSALVKEISGARKEFENYLQKAEGNVTERGEKDLLTNLRGHFTQYANGLNKMINNEIYDNARLQSLYLLARNDIDQLLDVNIDALLKRNEVAQSKARSAIIYMIAVSAIGIIGSFIFLITIPRQIARPYKLLVKKIEAISSQDFNQKIDLKTKDEFGKLARVFNGMTQKLYEYDQSNLNQILLEKSRVESIVKTLDQAIVLLDEKIRVIVVNPAASELLGIKAEEVLGKYAPDVATNNDLFREILKGVMVGKRTFREPVSISINGEESYYKKEVFEVKNYNNLADRDEFGGYIISLRKV